MIAWAAFHSSACLIAVGKYDGNLAGFWGLALAFNLKRAIWVLIYYT